MDQTRLDEQPVSPPKGRAVLATGCGRICMQRNRVNVSTVLAGQRPGIEEVGDGIWIARLMSYDLGFIDLEQKNLATRRQSVRPEVVTHVLESVP